MPFHDRQEAGRRLAARLAELGYAERDPVVLGLPRGGVPVAYEVARELGAPLDVLVVRKLGVPHQPELAMGAVGEGGVRVLNERVLALAQVTDDELAAVEERERAVIDQRVNRLRAGNPPAGLEGRTAIVVDDGIATGATARAACQVARAQGASRVVLATPVAPPERVPGLEQDADEVVCLETPSPFFAIGEFYVDFSQVSDDEVSRVLGQARQGDAPAPGARDEDVTVAAGPVRLAGRLTLPAGAQGLVVFAHGSGSSRHSPRNRFVAARLNEAGLGTLLFDLLILAEEHDRANVFDIRLLAARLVDATSWVRARSGTADVRIGYFGASTGTAAALWAAATPDSAISAVVSRGGRPDLAGPRLGDVRSPTLLIVGGRDDVVLELNREAQAMLRCESRLAVVPGATHLFEEPGTLQVAAELARDWFVRHLTDDPGPDGR